jgi:hypothetical protein
MVGERSPRQTWLWPYLLLTFCPTTAWKRPLRLAVVDQLPLPLVVVGFD